MASIPRILLKQFSNRANLIWAFPLSVGAGWILFPAIDDDWKMSVGLASDPEEGVNAVQAAKMARLEAFKKLHGISDVEKEEPEEDEEEDKVESESEDDDTDASGEEDEEAEEEEEVEIKIKPLYMPTKDGRLSPQDIWDNFTLKTVKMTEDDDEEEEEEEE